MAPALIRDATLGQIINRVSGGRLLKYDDQRTGYTVPARYLPIGGVSPKSSSDTADSSAFGSRTATLCDANGVANAISKGEEGGASIEMKAVSSEGKPILSQQVDQRFIVDFEENDPDRPRNWSKKKRYFVASQIVLLTMASYIGSAIYTPSIPGIMQEFGVGQVTATWGLTLFVVGYGLSPMIFGVTQEMASFGRTPLYVLFLGLYNIFQLPIIFAPNMASILVARFLTGFFAGPALATGGSSMADLFEMEDIPVAISVWACGAVAGPVLGPVVSGFAVQEQGWRWSIYILLMIGGIAFISLFCFLPETLESTILTRRAARLRRLTGNPLIRSQGEINEAKEASVFRVAIREAIIGFKVSADPSLLFGNMYIALVYSIFYLWFEAFPIVFTEMHHFNLGLSSLPFIGFIVTAIITEAAYVWYQKKIIIPRIRAGRFKPETRLEIGLLAGSMIPISLLIFGWTSAPDIHWIGPIIGAALYLPGIFLLFQGILTYIMTAYPNHGNAALAANDFFRSVFAGFWPLFGAKFFNALGVGPGSTFLAGVSLLMIPILYLLYRYGERLRSRSSYAYYEAPEPKVEASA